MYGGTRLEVRLVLWMKIHSEIVHVPILRYFRAEGEILYFDRSMCFERICHSTQKGRYVGSVRSYGIGDREMANTP